jgi:hypothetical protein
LKFAAKLVKNRLKPEPVAEKKITVITLLFSGVSGVIDFSKLF